MQMINVLVVVALCRPRAREVALAHGHAGTREVTPGRLKSHHNIAAQLSAWHALPSAFLVQTSIWDFECHAQAFFTNYVQEP